MYREEYTKESNQKSEEWETAHEEKEKGKGKKWTRESDGVIREEEEINKGKKWK